MSEIIIVNKEEIDALRADILELKKLLLAGQQTSTSKDEHVDAKTAANMLHITTRTLYTWEQKGLIKPSQLGRKKLYSVREINEIIEKNRLN